MKEVDLKEAEIEIRFDGLGTFGIHDGVFNGIVFVNRVGYYFQCSVNSDDSIDFRDCAHDWGLNADANEELAKSVGWENILKILKKAYEQYKSEEI